MLPHSSKGGGKSNDEQQGDALKKKKPKKSADNAKSREDAKDEKEKKRRSSLTDSPLTSSSSSCASTASRDSADDIDANKSKLESPSFKASDGESEENAIATSASRTKVSSSNQGIGQDAKCDQSLNNEDKSKKSKNKKKKKKKAAADDTTEPNAAAGMGADKTCLSKSQMGEEEDEKGDRSQPADKKKSSPMLLSARRTANLNQNEKPSYITSTASQLMGTNTVSSVNSRMSYLTNSFVDSTSLLHTFSTSSSSTNKRFMAESSYRDGMFNQREGYSYEFPNHLSPSGPQEIEIVEMNQVERDNVLDIFSNQNKHLQKFQHKWIRKLHQTITDGDYQRFLRRIRLVMLTLCRHSPRYQEIGVDRLAGFVIRQIVSHFHNEGEQTTILMALVSTRDITKSCEAIGHGFCKIAQTILKYLPLRERQSLLSVATRRCGKTALHLAVTSGLQCQVEVLLSNCVLPNVLDKSGRAALHYAIERSDIEKVKLLMWYGADMALCPSNNFDFPPQRLCIYNINANILAPWFSLRINALHHKLQMWIKNLCGDLIHVMSPISNMHFVRFCSVGDLGAFQSKLECSLDLRGEFTKQLSEPNTRAILFMVPLFFYPTDGHTSAEAPYVARAYFPDDVSLMGKPMLSTEYLGGVYLDHVFSPIHNSHIYAFTLPSNKIAEGSYKLRFDLKSTECAFGDNSVNYPILALRVHICRDIDHTKAKLL